VVDRRGLAREVVGLVLGLGGHARGRLDLLEIFDGQLVRLIGLLPQHRPDRIPVVLDR
jgi:hypothetical protein